MKTKRYIFIFFVLIIGFSSAYIARQYQKYRLYASEESHINLGFLFKGLGRYYTEHISLIDLATLQDTLLQQRWVKNGFPEAYHLLEKMDMDDFVYTRDSVDKISVWLFSEDPSLADSIIFLSEMTFTDFLLKKSWLITDVLAIHPCGSWAYIALDENRNRIQDAVLKQEFSLTRRLLQQEVKQLDIYDSIRWHCFHIYNNGDSLVVEDDCRGSDDFIMDWHDYSQHPVLYEIIKRRFKPLLDKEAAKDVYFYIY